MQYDVVIHDRKHYYYKPGNINVTLEIKVHTFFFVSVESNIFINFLQFYKILTELQTASTWIRRELLGVSSTVHFM